MDRSRDTYDMIKKNIIYEDKISYKKGKKQCIGCLVKSKYGDQSDYIEFYLFENKTAKGPFICLDLIEYEKAEKTKDAGQKLLRIQKVLFGFELIPKHQQQKELFACETEDNRNKWLKVLNETIEQLGTNQMYDNNTYLKRIYDENLSGEDDEIEVENHSKINNGNERQPPPIPPRPIHTHIELQSAAVINQLSYVLLRSKKSKLNHDDIFYQGTFEELHKILLNIDKPGVYAVSPKTKPESNSSLALRVYENEHTNIPSWNIYQTKETNEYYLTKNGLTFSSLVELCLYYTENDLPTGSSTINRLIVPYKHYEH